MATRKKIIIDLITEVGPLSCAHVCDYLINSGFVTNTAKKYLSGSVSSILAKLVKEKVLKYSDTKAIKGGHIYEQNNS